MLVCFCFFFVSFSFGEWRNADRFVFTCAQFLRICALPHMSLYCSTMANYIHYVLLEGFFLRLPMHNIFFSMNWCCELKEDDARNNPIGHCLQSSFISFRLFFGLCSIDGEKCWKNVSFCALFLLVTVNYELCTHSKRFYMQNGVLSHIAKPYIDEVEP